MSADLIIRPIRPDDAADIWETATLPNVMWGTVFIPTFTLEMAQQNSLPNPDVLRFNAEVDGRVVGQVGLLLESGRTRHAGEVYIYVHDDYQGRGIGRRLMEAALDLADNWLMLERVFLTVFADNDRARQLYESLGFVVEGISPGYLRRDGEWAAVHHMGRLRGRAAVPEEPVPLPLRPQGARATGYVRGALPADLPALYAIRMQPGVLRAMGRLPSWTPPEFAKEFSKLPPGQHLLVAEVDGQVVGMSHLIQYTSRRNHVGFITATAVDEAWQGQGVGGALARETVHLGDGWLGLRRLEVEVHADNTAAIAAYAKAGFVVETTHRSALIRDGRFIDVCLMGRTSPQ